MPTVSPEGPQPSVSESHLARHIAESFGVDAERYDRARPRYPRALVERIVADRPGPDVLDVGCGTGIAARQFRAAGCRVTGLEPDVRMAEWARQRGLDVEVATFEAWDPAGRTFDAVVAGQAWHWVDPVTGAAKAAETLRPGGRLALFWNVEQPPPEVAEAFLEVYRRVVPDALPSRRQPSDAAPYAALCDKAAEALREAGAFGEPEQWRFDWERSYTRDEWLDLLPTMGGFTRLPPAELTELLAGVGSVVDSLGGAFTMPYATVAVTARRGELV
ncbi:class I SAM-dependent methyltransferase [Streptomyces sp. RK75]|uniref:class I SAM-dependent methyltransferase n=1 Tax=Streptomyces sp. RK75 TaxID=2824895 RepID=UPI001B379E8E|nr:class I SAM-dependent methyltransferase [Streptomyces sp. RK75]MBQ0863548.1 methyltransferase domain-containing protein [Streptomyces sp. RK75]